MIHHQLWAGIFTAILNHMHYLALVLLLVTFPATAETVYQGKVIKIADGDTLTLLVDSKQFRIRLSDIDTPERKQPFGTKGQVMAAIWWRKRPLMHGVCI